jgi:long-subunit acyl-CoA synthetase (AMP-forming)
MQRLKSCRQCSSDAYVQAIMMNGAINAVRSGAASPQELLSILNTSEATGLVLQGGSVLESLADSLPKAKRKPKFVLLLWGDASSKLRAKVDCPVYTFDKVRCLLSCQMVHCNMPTMLACVLQAAAHRLPKR